LDIDGGTYVLEVDVCQQLAIRHPHPVAEFAESVGPSREELCSGFLARFKEMSMSPAWSHEQAVRSALQRLGIDRLVLSIHQASFPPSDDDVGHGTPYSERSGAMINWLARLGFTGVALGPSGITGRRNPSPYDATALSRNPLHIALGPLSDQGLIDERLLEEAVAKRPAGDLVEYDYAWMTHRRLLEAATLRSRGDTEVDAQLVRLRETRRWLEAEARYEAIVAAVGDEDWRRWPATPPQRHASANQFLLSQLLVRQQHAAFRERCRQVGLRIYGDLPIGVSHRDRYLFRGIFLTSYAMGAPPSRTNPEGQPWGYPLLDPDQLHSDGDAWRFALARFDAILQDHDGLRIDHPHGWVCPWVYRTDDPDPLHAVQNGARLFESPDLPDHPALAAHARIHPDQIDRSCPRHADNWVRAIDPAQIDRYARLFDLVVERIQVFGGDRRDAMVEVLSTCPRPLAEVLARHHLGRYRVTQKANLADPHDVYRSDLAHPQDWIMVGNHDTPPLRAMIDQWQGTGEWRRRIDYLATRLGSDSQERLVLASRFAQDRGALATAMLADLLCGPARNVLVFWADLFGLREIYNRPGVVDGSNWRLRVPADFEAAYTEARERGDAPDLALSIVWALHARGLDQDSEGRTLAAALHARQ
jgi:4-alpha-glucanotransferase